MFFQYIDYNAIYGNGGVLCYLLKPCEQMLAVQDTCGATCCRTGPEGEAAFLNARANHNYKSDIGPGPWLIATLDQFDATNTTNFGAGEWDMYPCPLQPAPRDFVNRAQLLARQPNNANVLTRWRSPGFACDPSMCSSAPLYPNENYGCYRCNEVSRVAYATASCTDNPSLHGLLLVKDTRQRWETDSYAACFYLVEQLVHCTSTCEVIPRPPALPPIPSSPNDKIVAANSTSSGLAGADLGADIRWDAATVSTLFTTAAVVAVVGSVVGSAATNIAGMPTTSGGGIGGSAGGGVLTIIQGMQRFVSVSDDGLAANLSDIYAETGERLTWIEGDAGFSLLSAENAACALPINPVNALFNVLLVLLLLLASLAAFQTVLHYLWKHRVNKRYYERKHNPRRAMTRIMKGRGTSSASGQSAILLPSVKFTPFPSPLVFPALPLIAMSLFCNGLVRSSVKILVARCDRWRPLAIAVLIFVGCYKLMTLSLLLRFDRRFRAATWKAAKPPPHANSVADPLYRWVSHIRVRCKHIVSLQWRPSSGNASTAPHSLVLDRARGKFAKPAGEADEPTRTERLLAHPATLARSLAGDTLDGIGFPLMARSGGTHLRDLLFEYVVLGASIAVAAISALGGLFLPSSRNANAQLATIACIQAAVSAYVLCLRPSADRVMNLLVGTQFLLEACATTVTFIASLGYGSAPYNMSFALALCSLIAPVLQRFYDAFVVHTSKALRKEGFSWKGAFFGFLGLVVFLPTLVLNLLGLNLGWSAKISEGAADDVNKMATKAANEGLNRSIQTGGTEAAVDLFWLGAVCAGERRKTREQRVSEAAQAIQVNWRRSHERQQRERRLSSLSPARNRAPIPHVPAECEFTGFRPGFVWLEAAIRDEEARDILGMEVEDVQLR